MDKKGLIEELKYFNAIACLLVVLIHVLSVGIDNADVSSWQFMLIYFPWRISAFVVPAFIFSSAVKMGKGFQSTYSFDAYKNYIKKRFTKIYLPYIFWNIIYYYIFLRIDYVQASWGGFLKMLLIGDLSAPFYFVVIIMQFYLLYPLWRWLVLRVKYRYLIITSVLITFIFSHLQLFLLHFGYNLQYCRRIFAVYLVFWMIGLCVGKEYNYIRKKCSRMKLIPFCGFFIVILYAIVSYFDYVNLICILDFITIKMLVDLITIYILLCFCIWLCRFDSFINRMLVCISNVSYSVYLSHCLFLTLITNYLYFLGKSDLTTLLVARFAVCYTIPFLIGTILLKLRDNVKCFQV